MVPETRRLEPSIWDRQEVVQSLPELLSDLITTVALDTSITPPSAIRVLSVTRKPGK